MASRSCVSFCSSLHVAFDSVFRCLFLQYREIEFAAIVGHNLPARFEPELFQENGLLLQVFLLLGNQIMEPSSLISKSPCAEHFWFGRTREKPCVLGCCSIVILQPFLYLCSLILCGFIMKDFLIFRGNLPQGSKRIFCSISLELLTILITPPT